MLIRGLGADIIPLTRGVAGRSSAGLVPRGAGEGAGEEEGAAVASSTTVSSADSTGSHDVQSIDTDLSVAFGINGMADADQMLNLVVTKGHFDDFPWDFATTLVREPSTH